MRFVLVHQILALEPGVAIEAQMSLPATEELFRDHFPGFPVVPGVLLTEMLAQTAGKCLHAPRFARGYAVLAEIRNAKFRGWVRPGDSIHLHATIETLRESFAVARCHAEVKDLRVCSADLLFSFLPMANLAHDFRDEVLERWVEENP